jgi:inner membrane protein
MLILAHTGLTLGAAAIFADVAKNRRLTLHNHTSWFATLSAYLDIRLLLIGSILPDIIDKPLGLLFLRDTLSSGRIYAHTLLFFVLITFIGLLLYRFQHKTWMLVLAAGTMTHLLLDQIWATPKTLFWPLLGLEFDRIEVTGWIGNILEALKTHPQVYIPEFIGFIILIWFGVVLILRKQLSDFIRHGQI